MDFLRGGFFNKAEEASREEEAMPVLILKEILIWVCL